MALSKQEQLNFAQQLLTLLNAGLALLNAIQLIYSSTPKNRQEWLWDVCNRLKSGNSLSQSLMAQRGQFASVSALETLILHFVLFANNSKPKLNYAAKSSKR